jgi:hypothetical protein
VEEVFRQLELYHGISRSTASQRLHEIKRLAGLGGDFDVEFDLTGNVYLGQRGELLGSLTDGGGP